MPDFRSDDEFRIQACFGFELSVDDWMESILLRPKSLYGIIQRLYADLVQSTTSPSAISPINPRFTF